MIVNWDNIRNDLNIPETAINMNERAAFRHAFLAVPGFGLSDITDQAEWQTALKNGNIFPFFNIQEVDANNLDPQYHDSLNLFQYNIRNGKKRYIFKYDVDIEFYQRTIDYSGQYLNVYFQDWNGNVYSVTSGSKEDGLGVDLIHIPNIDAGQSNVPSWSYLYIELKEDVYESVNVNSVPFSFSDLIYLTVSISNIVLDSSDTVTFDVADSLYSCPISGLVAGNFSVNDEINSISVSSLTDNGSGSYTLQGSDDFKQGIIIISSSLYGGSGNYDFFDGEFHPDEFSSEFKIS